MPARLLIYIVFLLTAVFCADKSHCGENRKPTEYEVKAAYIYNFAKFVEWPVRVKERSDVIRVCIIGDDPFGPSLATIEGKTAGGRSLETRRLTSLQQAGGCQMLYIAGSEERDLEEVVEAVKDTPVLTIGDTKGFTQRGVMVNFYMENNKVLFEINPNAAMRAGLKISSALLRIARIVGGP